MARLPNFIFLGPPKSGSSWLYEVLRWHPQAYVSQAREIFYFDQFYGRGPRWYASFFEAAGPEHKVLADISHDYLFAELACERMEADLPRPVTLMVTLREPVARAVSGWLYMIRQGRTRLPFARAVREFPELLDRGKYDIHLSRWTDTFGRDSMYVAIFDDLASDPSAFAYALFNKLGIAKWPLPEELQRPVKQAARSRSTALARLAWLAAAAIRRAGLPQVVGALKSMPLSERLLFARYSPEDRPEIDRSLVLSLQEEMRPHVEATGALLGMNLTGRWRYDVME